MLGLTNGGFRVKRQSNVILRNLYMHDPPESKDLIELQYSTYVWVDHCDLSTEGLTGDKDYYDGLLDITHVRGTSVAGNPSLSWHHLSRH